MIKSCYIYLFDGFSDWEIAYLTPEIQKSETCRLVYFSKDGKTVRSMGGMQVVADKSISELDCADMDMLILPGGAMWAQNVDKEIVALITKLNEKHKSIAAICAATAELAALGMLDNVLHTSNALEYLKWAVPNYTGERNYVDQPAVTGNNIITACGIAPIEFAREVFNALHLKNETEIAAWYQLYKNGIWSE